LDTIDLASWVAVQLVDTTGSLSDCSDSHVVGQDVASVLRNCHNFCMAIMAHARERGDLFLDYGRSAARQSFRTWPPLSRDKAKAKISLTQTLSFIMHPPQGYPHSGSTVLDCIDKIAILTILGDAQDASRLSTMLTRQFMMAFGTCMVVQTPELRTKTGWCTTSRHESHDVKGTRLPLCFAADTSMS
jgi:hypothetical protein